MKTVIKTSIFPASKHKIFTELQKPETLQYIAFPYASFEPVSADQKQVWEAGNVSSWRFRLFGIIPYGIHKIRIIRFDEEEGISSREGNKHVPVWNHNITLKEIDSAHTEYTDHVEIEAGWKTDIVYLWACCFYAHRQKRWISLIKNQIHG